MAKKIHGYIRLQLSAGAANPAPPVGPALGAQGVNIMAFCKDFNARTKDQAGMILPVVITVYTDKSFTYEEVENQGAYAPIGAGNRAEWTVRWTLTSIAAIQAGVGPADIVASSSLRQAVEQVADAEAALQ